MKTKRALHRIALAATLGGFSLIGLRADEPNTRIRFADPSKPGTLRVLLARGNVRITGSDDKEVAVSGSSGPKQQAVRKDGLRVLTAAESYSVNQADNVITLDALDQGWMGGSTNLRISVPRSASIIVSDSLGGDVRCAGIDGDIDIKSLNGHVELDGISGGALVETMNGGITATVRELQRTKPLSFTSTNGAVVLHLAPTAKANIRFRTQNGSILTDFDEKELATRVEALAPRIGGPHGILTPEAREAFRDAARAGADAARRAAEAVREAAEAAREGMEGDNAGSNGTPNWPPSPAPAPLPIPHFTAIPTVTGGKLVTGSLNGGGPEISVITLNGDIVLRRIGSK